MQHSGDAHVWTLTVHRLTFGNVARVSSCNDDGPCAIIHEHFSCCVLSEPRTKKVSANEAGRYQTLLWILKVRLYVTTSRGCAHCARRGRMCLDFCSCPRLPAPWLWSRVSLKKRLVQRIRDILHPEDVATESLNVQIKIGVRENCAKPNRATSTRCRRLAIREDSGKELNI